MHGRLKVKTTEEQQEAKRKEREKKLKLYTAGTQKVFEKRKKKEYDGEILEVCAQLLSANPDVYTLWNVRKETFQVFAETKSCDEMKDLYDRELGFIENCLRVNPKSYGAWYHRCWVMDHTPKPDWKQELKLCNLYLEYDERNFHCWDYRRFVVARSDVALSDDLEFTSTKISTNFSNYSSWHYRSKLLPQLHPDQEKKGRIKEEILMQEYELVQNAFFTDPNDQSAWFYHRWLMGRGEKPLGIQVMYVNSALNQIMVIFSQPVNLQQQPAVVFLNDQIVDGTWKNSRNNQYHSIMWIYTVNSDALNQEKRRKLEVKLSEDVCRTCHLDKGVTECWSKDVQDSGSLFTAELSDEKTEFLKTELESCQQLRELEPDNKWCLLTVILLMRVLDPLKLETEMLSCFTTILAQDTYRADYFKDLRSKFIMENAIMRYLQERSKVTESSEVNKMTFDVSGKELTTLHHLEHLSSLRFMDFSNNNLLALNDVDLLRSVSDLKADDNKIKDISHLCGLPSLETLSLKNNNISSLIHIEPLAACPNLQNLDLTGNPICDIDMFRSEVGRLLPQLKSLNNKSL
nr:geranylgeranyl transferase type-2 subunit alpha-like [Lytechinus pictus]